MIDAKIVEHAPGFKVLWCIEEVHPDGNPAVGRDIPLAMIASWRELLGIDDPVEVVEAIIQVMDTGEPAPDDTTGAHHFTNPIALLTAREEAREAAAKHALQQGTSLPSGVRTRAANAAYRAVHQKIDGGECAMDRCRRDSRAALGIKEPSKICGVTSRHVAPEVKAVPTVLTIEAHGHTLPAAGPLTKPDQSKVRITEALAGLEDELLIWGQVFLHGLAGAGDDVLSDAPEPPATLPTAEDLIAAYGGDTS